MCFIHPSILPFIKLSILIFFLLSNDLRALYSIPMGKLIVGGVIIHWGIRLKYQSIMVQEKPLSLDLSSLLV